MLEFFKNLTKNEPISFAHYVRECLYNRNFGYYVKARKRVGKDGDFQTSVSLNGDLFSRLILEAARSIANQSDFEICELGAEPGAPLFENSKSVRFSDELILSGNLFLFSNELLDAQAFERFYFEGGKIFKSFLKFKNSPEPEIILKDASNFECEILRKYFGRVPEPFILDFSLDALNLLEKICTQNWQGVLIFADYFRSATELLAFPKGTARIYYKHGASTDIFINSGECDITFSPNFENFLDTLNAHGFKKTSCISQASFFVNNAENLLREITENSSPLSREKRSLMELISPTHMGETFRVLSGVRL